MKKILIIFLSLFLSIAITGCNKEEKTLVCTTTQNEDGMSIEEVISMSYVNDKLKAMQMSVNTKISDEDIKENWENFKETMNENNVEFSEEGINYQIEVNDDTYEYKTILNIDIAKASEDTLKKQGFDGLKDDKSTLEETKKEAEEDGATCVVK